MERYVLITARMLMSIMFLLDGLNLISQSLAAHEMATHGVPASVIPLMILGAQALQLVASLGLIFGIYPRLAALALILFLIPATLMAHGGHTAVHGPDDQLPQERVYDWGTPFSRRHKRPTCSASAFGALTEAAQFFE
jgi:uncharacterized membrane protein YphA (DoxX/SURF4 family)